MRGGGGEEYAGRGWRAYGHAMACPYRPISENDGPRMTDLDDLRTKSSRDPGNAMFRNLLGIELYNALSDAQDEGDLAARDALRDELRSLAAAHPADANVRKRLAKACWIVLMHAHEGGDIGGRDRALAELRELGSKYRDDAHVDKYVRRADNIFR